MQWAQASDPNRVNRFIPTNWGPAPKKKGSARRCLTRAVEDAARGDLVLRDLGWAALRQITDVPVAAWNDLVGRHVIEVVTLLERAITECRAKFLVK